MVKLSNHHQSHGVAQALPELCTVPAMFFMVLVGELLALVLTLAETGLRQFSWYSFAMVSLYTLWVILLSAGLLCNLRSWIGKFSGPAAAGISYALVICVAVIVSIIAQQFLNPETASLDFWKVSGEVIITVIFAGIAGRYFYVQQQLREQQKAELNSRLEALQARIRPHFLFNSMNSIASLIAEDPVAAEDLVLDLSDLFRASMANELQVTLSEEIAFGQRYMRIEQARLGERLQLDWQLSDDCKSAILPALILQPLLENAVYHGVQPIPSGGMVKVAASKVDNNCQIEITNPVPTNGQSRQGNQMALENIQHRLDAMYVGKANFIAEQQGNIFVVQITVPFINKTPIGV